MCMIEVHSPLSGTLAGSVGFTESNFSSFAAAVEATLNRYMKDNPTELSETR